MSERRMSPDAEKSLDNKVTMMMARSPKKTPKTPAQNVSRGIPMEKLELPDSACSPSLPPTSKRHNATDSDIPARRPPTRGRRYRRLRKIGEGSYGSVCSADDSETGERVAIKIIKDSDKMGCGEALHLLLEIKILQHTHHHPNVVQLKEVIPRHVIEGYSYYDQLYLVFALANSDLEKRIVLGRPFEPLELKTVFHQILRGMACMHEAGIVHRDIKPNNILISSGGLVQVADLGCAVAQGVGDLKAELPNPELVGTPSYQPPELLLRAAHNDPSMDMWAAGCILGEMMALQQLFRGETVEVMLSMVMSALGEPTPEDLAALHRESAQKEALLYCKPWAPANWARLMPGHLPAAIDLLERLLKFNPKKRYTAKSALGHPIFSSVNADAKNVAAMKAFEFSPGSVNCLSDIWAEIRDQATMSPSRPIC